MFRIYKQYIQETFNEWFVANNDAAVSRYECFLMYLSTTITHKWRLVHKHIMDENMVKHSCGNTKYVFIGEEIIPDK